MTMNMRHWAILAIAATGISAMFTETPLEDLTGIFGALVAVIVGDKAISLRKKNVQ